MTRCTAECIFFSFRVDRCFLSAARRFGSGTCAGRSPWYDWRTGRPEFPMLPCKLRTDQGQHALAGSSDTLLENGLPWCSPRWTRLPLATGHQEPLQEALLPVRVPPAREVVRGEDAVVGRAAAPANAAVGARLGDQSTLTVPETQLSVKDSTNMFRTPLDTLLPATDLFSASAYLDSNCERARWP